MLSAVIFEGQADSRSCVHVSIGSLKVDQHENTRAVLGYGWSRYDSFLAWKVKGKRSQVKN